MKQYRPYLIASLLYLLFAVFFTFPLVLHLNDSILGPPEDNMHNVWNFWWAKKALFETEEQLYFTDYIFYPSGIPLYFNAFSLLHILLFLPLQLMGGPHLTYNLVMLLTFVLRGLAMFSLARHFLKNKQAAFVAGFIYTFCPFFMHKMLHHLNLAATQYLVWALLVLLQLIQQPKWGRSLLLGILLFCVSLSSWVYLVFLVPMFAFVLVYYLVTDRKKVLNQPVITHALAGFVLFGVLISYFVYPLFREILLGHAYMEARSPHGHWVDLAAFFIPSDIHPVNGLVNDAFLRFYNHMPGDNWELNFFVGFTVLGLCVLGYVRSRFAFRKFWLWWWIVFLLIAMGDSVHVAGFDLRIPLPYAVIKHVPLLKLARVPGRFFAVALIPICIFAGFGMIELQKWLQARSRLPMWWAVPGFVAGLVCVLATVEYLPFPVERVPVDPPVVYANIAQSHAHKAVLEIPLEGYRSHYKDAKYVEFMGKQYRQSHYVSMHLSYMYAQVHHGKKIFSGYASRVPPLSLAYWKEYPMHSLYALDTVALARQGVRDSLFDEIEHRKVGWVLVHEGYVEDLFPQDGPKRIRCLHEWLSSRYQWEYDPESRTRIYFVET